MKVTKFVTHSFPHVDELAAIFVAKRFGSEMIKGAKEAPVVYSTSQAPSTLDPWEKEKEGIVYVGLGGGRFDEHGEERMENECAFTLMLGYLGMKSDCRFQRLSQIIFREDSRAGLGKKSLGYVLKIAWAFARTHNLAIEEVSDWVFDGFEALICAAGQGDLKGTDEEIFSVNEIFSVMKKSNPSQANEWIAFSNRVLTWHDEKAWPDAVREYRKKSKLHVLTVDGVQMRVVTILSTNELMNKVSRSRFGHSAHVFIQVHDEDTLYTRKGLFQVFTSKPSGGKRIDLRDVVKWLRIIEGRSHGIKRIPNGELLAEHCETIPNIYWHKVGHMILNGSLTTPDIEPSELSFDKKGNVSTKILHDIVVRNVRWEERKEKISVE